MRLRRLMFEAMGFDDPAKLDAGDVAAADYFAQAIPSGEFQGWLAVTPEGEAALQAQRKEWRAFSAVVNQVLGLNEA